MNAIEEGQAMRSSRRSLCALACGRRRADSQGPGGSSPVDASVYHALVVIFFEFFAWGLLTVPVINVLAETFPTNKFLMNGLVLGIRGILSFLSAPLIGALSDIWGRKFFLLLTVLFTCLPIPCLAISPWYYFVLFGLSGVFSVTFSVVLAYVADITERQDRTIAYGLVSATFAASLVTSPALGAYLGEAWSDEAVVWLATAISAFDVLFVLCCVPESLPIKLRHSTWDRVTWSQTDPFRSLRLMGEERSVVLLCTIVLLSYLPEAGQFSCFFVYLKLVIGFSPEAVAGFIGLVGILSVFAQTAVLSALTTRVGSQRTIHIGLLCQCAQLLCYGLGSSEWLMWGAGVLAAMSQITYPAISAYVSVSTDRDKQGTVQGMVTGMRGLCQGLGPALFGFIFYMFHVDLSADADGGTGHAALGAAGFPAAARPRYPHYGHWGGNKMVVNGTVVEQLLVATTASKTEPQLWGVSWRMMPGPPFFLGAWLVAMAILVNSRLPPVALHGAAKAPGKGADARLSRPNRRPPTHASPGADSEHSSMTHRLIMAGSDYDSDAPLDEAAPSAEDKLQLDRAPSDKDLLLLADKRPPLL